MREASIGIGIHPLHDHADDRIGTHAPCPAPSTTSSTSTSTTGTLGARFRGGRFRKWRIGHRHEFRTVVFFLNLRNIHLVQMVPRVEHDVVVRLDPLFDGHKLIVGRTDFDFSGVPFFAFADQDKVMPFGFVHSMHGDLERFVDLFDEDSYFSGHPGTDRLGWLDDLNEGCVFFNVRTPPIAGLGVLVDFDHPSEQFVFGGVDANFHRHAFANQADPRFVDFRFDLHTRWVWEQKNGLLLADQRSGLDDEVATTSTRAFVRIDNLAIGRSEDGASFRLGLDFLELVLFFPEGVFIRLEFGSRRFDIGIELDEHFRFGQFIEDLQAAQGRFEVALCIFDGELFSFDLKGFKGPFGRKPLGAFEREFGFA